MYDVGPDRDLSVLGEVVGVLGRSMASADRQANQQLGALFQQLGIGCRARNTLTLVGSRTGLAASIGARMRSSVSRNQPGISGRSSG
jgi:hypothetical protein